VPSARRRRCRQRPHLTRHALVNAKGLTLYLYEGDSASHLSCTAPARALAPLSGPATATGAAKPSDLGTIKRAQHPGDLPRPPLYTFAGDSKAGQTGGEGITLDGRKWYAISPRHGDDGEQQGLLRRSPAAAAGW